MSNVVVFILYVELDVVSDAEALEVTKDGVDISAMNKFWTYEKF